MLLLSRQLAWLGLVPFGVALIMSALNFRIIGISGTLLFISYSTIILSFMAGTIWGQANHNKSSRDKKAILYSNLWALTAWCALLLYASLQMKFFALLMLLAIYMHIVWIEQKLFIDTGLSKEVQGYQQMRIAITACVVVLHALMLLNTEI